MYEHYGVEVATGRVRRQSLAHGAQLSGLKLPPAKEAAATVVTQLDGSMIPIVEPDGAQTDRRQGKLLLWQEARLCLSRRQQSLTPIYGATLGSTSIAGALWRQTAEAVGWNASTRVHGVGDGADWITTQFHEQFGQEAAYLVDFWHVSEYLAAAAQGIAPKQPKPWLRKQQGHLLENQSGKVLRALAPHLEAADQEEAPVRSAHRYLSQRRHQLDYAGARRNGLPIGSGEIEGGHRHVIQERLKLTGCWWKRPNAQAMLGLRVARANQLWSSYWNQPHPQQN